MKNSLTIILLLCAAISVAQTKIEKSIESRNGDKVVLDFKFANEVKIITWKEQEVELVASVRMNDTSGEELYEITAEREGNKLQFYSNSDEMQDHWKSNYHKDDCCQRGSRMVINIEVKMPANLDLEYNSISGGIEVPALTGQLNLNTISGDITISPQEKPIYAKSISGDVELLVQNPLNADFYVKTISGEVYSNLEFEYLDKKDGLRQVVGQKVKGRLNSGGEKWELETISGDIFLREI